ncbi:aldehyde dehydrogenase family 3 member B1-like [Pristis pectinata]|uniref:aldehyde dehydrogenase family 3 member B1-like n=1 Tax=Pristis pectinata TaxID=685728 RepID=UPI00223E7337|nr:aldehyde dehydrogenase family 3 member B1-like [Pristis pectinata]
MAGFSDSLLRLRASFSAGKTRPLEFRCSQLNALLCLLRENEEGLLDALYADLRKSRFEALVTELRFVKNEAWTALNNLERWSRPEGVERSFVTKLDHCFIRREPLGVVLIIGTWSHPVRFLLTPLVGAMAAGNAAVLKPSEVSGRTSETLASLIPRYLDKECFAVFTGGPSETRRLLQYKFDYIFYTGGSPVGKLVMKAAAEHLTPVTLELGGKNPCYVSPDADPESTARRLVWGRFLNAGQSCLGPDLVLCTPEVRDRLLPALKRSLREFYGPRPRDSPDYGRIVDRHRFRRLRDLLGSGRVVLGGEWDEEERYIAPTVLVDVKESDPVMKEEIFGPILPILSISSMGEAIEVISRGQKPLAVYVFSSCAKVIREVLDHTSSGGFCSNDNLMQSSLNTLPFGGVGSSGFGTYHGRFSFETFSHRRACLLRSPGLESLNVARYPPYNQQKLNWILWVTDVRRRDCSCSVL